MSALKLVSSLWSLSFAIVLLLPGLSPGTETISPVHEEEFREAARAIGAARAAQAEQFAPEPFQQAQELLATAENARGANDGVKFSQASRLSRAYAELARTIAQLKAEEGKLAAAKEELRKARAELEAAKRSP